MSLFICVDEKNRAMSQRKLSTKYVPKSLSRADAAKQRESIMSQTARPKVKYRTRRSPWVKKFEAKYGKKITNDTFIDKNIITRAGIAKILDKGRGAYYSSGSRPNQTAESWARARLAAVIMGSPGARRVDAKIWERFKR